MKITVVIPLYNKRDDVMRAVASACSQSLPPVEVIVVDDGSTDGGGEAVEAAQWPLEVRVVRQANAGVSAARNRGIAQAAGDYVALLDADDWWEEGFLAETASLAEEFPGCGIYCTGFNVHRRNGVFPNERIIHSRGIIDNYFATAPRAYVCHSSGLMVPRAVFEAAGGFPEGMKLGEDLYMWTKIAMRWPVCYSPAKLSNYNLNAPNRSTHSYRIEQTPYSFREFYTPGWDDLNEYIARCELGKAITHSVNGYTREARETERFYAYTRRSRLAWWKLRTLNRLPVAWRKPLLRLYGRLAWLVSRKGVFEQ